MKTYKQLLNNSSIVATVSKAKYKNNQVWLQLALLGVRTIKTRKIFKQLTKPILN